MDIGPDLRLHVQTSPPIYPPGFNPEAGVLGFRMLFIDSDNGDSFRIVFDPGNPRNMGLEGLTLEWEQWTLQKSVRTLIASVPPAS